MTDASGPPATEQAQQKAQEAAGKAQNAVREQVDRRSTEAGERISGTAQDMRSVGEELRKQGKDGPARIADQAASRTERFGSYLTESDSDTILGDIEDFGRRQPMAMLAGGLALGVVAARFLKASSRRRFDSRTSSETRTRELGTAVPSQPAPSQQRIPAERQPVPSAPAAPDPAFQQ